MESYNLVLNGLEAFTPADFKDHEVERLQLLAGARRLISRLETEQETVFNIAFQQPITYAAIRVCLDLKLWRQWKNVGGGEKTLDELAKLTTVDCDLNLLRRLLRLLGATNIIEETGEDRYKPTRFSLSIGDESTTMPQAAGSKSVHWGVSSLHLPLFLEKTSYREPLDPKNTNYSDATPEHLAFFDRCLSNKDYQDGFSGFMREWSKYRYAWPKFYDTDSLVNGADISSGAPLLVDIGGHHGHDILTFLDKHPDVPAGSLVLQDLGAVLSEVHLDTDKIKLMPQSFFEPQPIHGSRAYFLRGVFHDWAHEPSLQILRNIAPAMKKGYSKLLICDIVIPPTGASIYQTGMDVNMMALLSALERTEAMWTKLINEAGFRIVKIWKDPRGYEAVIEAELA